MPHILVLYMIKHMYIHAYMMQDLSPPSPAQTVVVARRDYMGLAAEKRANLQKSACSYLPVALSSFLRLPLH